MVIVYAKDELGGKIERARMALAPESRAAIDSVDWQSIIVGMRESKKFSFSQIETLGIATETILAGLMSGEEYKRELGTKMGLSKDDTDKLVAEMNEMVFRKIKENLIARLGSERAPVETKVLPPEISKEDSVVLESAGISIDKQEAKESGAGLPDASLEAFREGKDQMIAQIENTDLIKKPSPIITKKLSTAFQAPIKVTEYKAVEVKPGKPEVKPVARTSLPNIDPYREQAE